MKFSCEKKLLVDAVNGVSRAISSSSTIPVLQGVLMKTSGFKLSLTGYDLDMAITTEIEVNVQEKGEIVLPAKIFSDMVKSLPSDQVTVESNDQLLTHIEGGITEYDMMGMSAEDYPELPVPGADRAFEIDAAELAAMIEGTIYAVSTDDKKPAHTGELFSIAADELTIVALDGFRLAITHHPIMSDSEISIVVPAKTASEAARLMGNSGENISVDANRRYVVFSGAGYTVMSRLIEGDFLNYKNVVPEGYKTRVVVDVPSFEKSIERCSVILTERLKNPLRVTFGDGAIDIRCKTPLGKVNDRIEAEIEGEKIEIGFNYRYLLDALRNTKCDRVVLELSGPLAPVKIIPAEGDDFLFLVLPVRFSNE